MDVYIYLAFLVDVLGVKKNYLHKWIYMKIKI